MSKLFALVFAFLACTAPAAAQWQTPDHSVPIGRGAGNTGFRSVLPGTSDLPFLSNGPSADPSFRTLPNAGMTPAPAYTIKGNATGGTAAPTDISPPALTQKALPTVNDWIIISDVAAANALKKATVGSLSQVTLGPPDVYVNSASGNDANNCLSSGLACATIQHAMNLVTQAVFYKNTAPNIRLATPGTYNEQVTCPFLPPGATTINIIGDTTTKTNVVWVPQAFTPPSGGLALLSRGNCDVTVSGVSFQSSATACAVLDAFGGIIRVKSVQFGSLTISPATGCGYHVLVDNNGIYSVEDSDYVLTGSMTYHVLVVGPSKVQWVGSAINVTTPLTFVNFFNLSGAGASINFDATVICSGTGCAAGSTGSPYSIFGPGSISPNSTVVPGNGVGVLNAGGSYNLLSGGFYQKIAPTTYATLNATFPCNAANAGVLSFLVDATLSAALGWGVTVTGGGGANGVLAMCNGANYVVH